MIQYIVLVLILPFTILGSNTLPKKISQFEINGSKECPIGMEPTESFEKVEVILNQVNLDLNRVYGPPCQCGGKWRKLVDLDMSSSSQSCPSGWQLVDNDSVRGCGRPSTGCASTVFSANSSYSRVCGRIIAVQFGTPDALYDALQRGIGIDSHYLDGVSITHGFPGSHQHIWSFIAANSEQTLNKVDACPCSDTTSSWSFSIPSFIGDNYFCDSGQKTFSYRFIYFTDNPLWDGQGCSSTSSCCTLHNPPWFCTDIDNAISDDIEVRICCDDTANDEEIVVTNMELYIQ